jgi:serine/threonine protein kinase
VLYAQVVPKAHQHQLKEKQQRLQQQLSVQQALQHEHIVRLLGSCEDSSNIYLLMELCSEWLICVAQTTWRVKGFC